MNDNGYAYLVYTLLLGAQLYAVEGVAMLVAGVITNFVVGLIVFSSMISMLLVFNGYFIAPANIPDFFIW